MIAVEVAATSADVEMCLHDGRVPERLRPQCSEYKSKESRNERQETTATE